jgi:hypothetical protein
LPRSSKEWDSAIDNKPPNPLIDPVATYLHINNKIHNNPDPESEYPPMEIARDLARMLLAAEALIIQNSNLSTRVLKAEKFAEDAAVNLLSKDLETYELSQALAHCRKETQNGTDIC